MLLQVLDTYKPLVWEYARLNLTHNVLSKRKLNKLVTQGYVHGWDDPRLLTLAGLRRRGVRPQVMLLTYLSVLHSRPLLHPALFCRHQNAANVVPCIDMMCLHREDKGRANVAEMGQSYC